MLANDSDDDRIAAYSDRVTAVLDGKLPQAQRAGAYGTHLAATDLMMAIDMVAGLVAKTPAAERQVTADRAWVLLRRAFAP